ncbi:MAG: hypothetical protein JNN06_02130 [Gemmobacter sp.]|uniref:hypothetical protein n=1 Tax=Gemmobacter sp. TaxID=1898957 RepID=UPI001A3C6CF8|nr:hypothetical protein [Gemmobacter sp.]MBL8561053.1 hypothetical protein [Gemmobacter sp.]
MFVQTALAALGPAAAAVIFASVAQWPLPPDLPPEAGPVVHPAMLSASNGYDPDFTALDGLTVYDDLGHEVATTEPNCQPHETISTMLSRDYVEAPRMAAMTEGGLGLELWASDDMGTWTAVHRGSDGISCVVASGIDWGPATDAQALLERAVDSSVVMF